MRGELPVSGLLVSNHLSYVDILLLSALTPCAFVAKREVKGWPIFGWFATLAGTVFVDRGRRSQVAAAAKEITTSLDTGIPLVLFPEGTSTGGDVVLPFKSSLLEPISQANHCVTASLIQYELSDGDPSEEICYWKDMTLLPHLLNLLGKQSVRAEVCFVPFRQTVTNRKELAQRLHATVLDMATNTRTFTPTGSPL